MKNEEKYDISNESMLKVSNLHKPNPKPTKGSRRKKMIIIPITSIILSEKSLILRSNKKTIRSIKNKRR